MATVGIIANPGAGKDIRRLVSKARFVPNQEKVNILKRVLAGIEAAGVDEVVMMPDAAMLGRMALDGVKYRPRVQFLNMPVFNEEADSSRAAALMAQMGAGCLITIGGDGTNRAAVKGSADVPIVAVSTGTNNVFPAMVEGTSAGLAAGVVARGLVELQRVSKLSNYLQVSVDGAKDDVALVDIAVSREPFVGARAIWDIGTVHEIFLARAEPASTGLSAIGARLQPLSIGDGIGMYLLLGPRGALVMAPIAPGLVCPVAVAEWRLFPAGERVQLEPRGCTIALDGERSFALQPHQRAQVYLSNTGPRVVSVEAVMREAALKRLFVDSSYSNLSPPSLRLAQGRL